ncbi:hypothetical protein MBM_08716 [Drepanopeziza brunnea f. sp. 'multigermtubi' MB_m1]|uniref:Uncharacterized protein n=1 Tax=Marssonina brunnea f. sp. multigermtubi (strain MB_m1) TaxID=1072389 RepID=K1WX61_MARBU|nr:uncharacterized protein MBM_08716 [Drepanopeziza brunnea f. sp. 'multigermtubi' MB_m1]EKD13273.1 hypothetical protein MBM_08716 [Drepanopeziza brunnea f. sp. 'multigermtubi' MB_m1]
MPLKQVTQFNKIVKRGRGRLRNPLSALAVAAATAAAAVILRTLTSELSPFLLDLFIKRLLMLTTVKALNYNNCTAAFAVANTAFENFSGNTKRFEHITFSQVGGPLTADMLSEACQVAREPWFKAKVDIEIPTAIIALALALAAFVILVAFTALVAPVALIIVALFALVVALAAFAAALAVAITLTKRRAKVKRLLRALIDLLL